MRRPTTRTLFTAALLGPTLLGPALLAGCTRSPAASARALDREAATQAELNRALAGFTPEPAPGGCFDPSFYRGRSQGTKAYGKTLLFTVDRNLIYRTDTQGGCERVGRNDALVTSTPAGRNCAGDIATTFDTAARVQTGSCAFGPFVVYRRPR